MAIVCLIIANNDDSGNIMIDSSTDYAAMTGIWLKSSLDAHSFISREFWHSHVEAMKDKYLPGCENYAYTDEDTGRMCGFISLRGDHIEALFVDPDCQGKGIGKALLAYAASLRDRLTLSVYTKNTRAAEFYRRNGFIAEERHTDPATGEDELIMVRQGDLS